MTNVLKNLVAILALLLLLCTATTRAQVQETAAFLIMDQTSGHVFESKNPNRKLQVGSLTKIATAMVALDWTEKTKRDLGEFATVPSAAFTVDGTNPISFQPGDRVTLRELLYAALLQSDNIAAYTIADFIGRTLQSSSPEVVPADRFVAQMNALARQLRMQNTLFLNPSGLDSIERKLPYSTASDMGRLTAYAMSKSAFRFYVSQKSRKIAILHADGTQTDYMLENTNELLGTDGIDGVKTGKTRRAGECVIISASRPPESRKEGETVVVTPRRIIVVVLGSMQRFPLAAGLLNRGWSMYDQWAAAGRPVKSNETL